MSATMLTTGLGQGGDVLPAGVVHQGVDAAVRRQHLGHHLAYRIFLADVADVGAGQAAVLHDLGLHGQQLVSLAPQQRDPRTERGQFMRRAAADTGPAAGDQGHPAGHQARGKSRKVRHPHPPPDNSMRRSLRRAATIP
jgi:hypothetical protein